MNTQILCASNTLLIAALAGILFLQAGDWYAEREQTKLDKATISVEKKAQ